MIGCCHKSLFNGASFGVLHLPALDIHGIKLLKNEYFINEAVLVSRLEALADEGALAAGELVEDELKAPGYLLLYCLHSPPVIQLVRLEHVPGDVLLVDDHHPEFLQIILELLDLIQLPDIGEHKPPAGLQHLIDLPNEPPEIPIAVAAFDAEK